MRVMLDTNIIVSALLFPGKWINDFVNKLTTEHQLVLSQYIVDELKDVTHRKFPDKVDTVDTLLKHLPFELVVTPAEPEPGLFEIRDAKDYPVLCSAISADVDVLITNDKDFDDVEVDKPEIMTPGEFVDKY